MKMFFAEREYIGRVHLFQQITGLAKRFVLGGAFFRIAETEGEGE